MNFSKRSRGVLCVYQCLRCWMDHVYQSRVVMVRCRPYYFPHQCVCCCHLHSIIHKWKKNALLEYNDVISIQMTKEPDDIFIVPGYKTNLRTILRNFISTSTCQLGKNMHWIMSMQTVLAATKLPIVLVLASQSMFPCFCCLFPVR